MILQVTHVPTGTVQLGAGDWITIFVLLVGVAINWGKVLGLKSHFQIELNDLKARMDFYEKKMNTMEERQAKTDVFLTKIMTIFEKSIEPSIKKIEQKQDRTDEKLENFLNQISEIKKNIVKNG